MARTGQFTGNPDQAKRLLDAERLILVFPEGARGTAKLAKDADTLVKLIDALEDDDDVQTVWGNYTFSDAELERLGQAD